MILPPDVYESLPWFSKAQALNPRQPVPSWVVDLFRILNTLEEHVEYAKISLNDFRAVKFPDIRDQTLSTMELVDECQLARRKNSLYTITFIGMMRKTGRLLKHLAGKYRQRFPSEVADAVRLSWRIRASMFDKYTAPRDAVEHLDERLESASMMNMFDDVLVVVSGSAGSVSEVDLSQAEAAIREIEAAALEYFGLRAVRQRLVDVLSARCVEPEKADVAPHAG